MITHRPLRHDARHHAGYRKYLSLIQHILLTCCICCAPPALGAEVVKLVSADYPPYFGPQLAQGGVLNEIVRQAFARSNYQVQVQFLPWARAVREVKEGNADGIIAIAQTAEDESLLAFSTPLIYLEIGFYKQRDRSIEFKELHELKPYKIGTVRGNLPPTAFVSANLSTFDSLDDTTNLRKLALGRLDLVLTEKAVGKYLVENRLNDMRIALNWQGQMIANPSQHVAFSKKRGDYDKKLQVLNEGLRQMAQDGSLKELLHQAGVD